MTRFRRRITALVTVSLAATGLAACGKHVDEEARIQRTETEGLYLHLDHLKYQVQISRQLNPEDISDRPYLAGVPVAERDLEADEVWFGVFLRVQNDGEKIHRPTSDITIVDTQETEYEPIPLGPENVFAYRPPLELGSEQILPAANSAASETPIQGELLLFKVTNATLDNRPLELVLEGKDVPQQTGIIDLDV